MKSKSETIRDPTDGVKLRGPQLRALGPLVRLNLIRAGDVLLTRGRGVSATATAFVSGGKYSHAALWLPLDFGDVANSDDLHLIEADQYGVGPTVASTILIREAGNWNRVAHFHGSVGVALLRHPDMENLASSKVRAAAATFQKSELYRSYFPYGRLADASCLPPALRPAVAGALQLVDTRTLFLPGAFCSELVAKFFAELGLSLFDPAIPPHTVSPSRLADADCKLVSQSQILISPETLTDDMFGWQTGSSMKLSQGASRIDLVEPVVSHSEYSANVAHQVDSIAAQLTAIQLSHSGQQREINAELFGQIETAMRERKPFEPNSARTSLRRIYAASIFLFQLDACLNELTVESSERPDLALHQAIGSLREMHHKLSGRIVDEFAHREMLHLLAILRQIKPKSRGLRKRVIRRWRKNRAERRENVKRTKAFTAQTPAVAEILTTPEFQAHFQAILSRAHAAAVAEIREKNAENLKSAIS